MSVWEVSYTFITGIFLSRLFKKKVSSQSYLNLKITLWGGQGKSHPAQWWGHTGPGCSVCARVTGWWLRTWSVHSAAFPTPPQSARHSGSLNPAILCFHCNSLPLLMCQEPRVMKGPQDSDLQSPKCLLCHAPYQRESPFLSFLSSDKDCLKSFQDTVDTLRTGKNLLLLSLGTTL